MLSFKEFLNEMKVIENYDVYFVLPMRIPTKFEITANNKDKDQKILKLIKREFKIQEVLDCIFASISLYKSIDDNRFVIQDKRDNNKEFLMAINCLHNGKVNKHEIYMIISQLKVSDFYKSSIDVNNKSIAYVFLMKNFIKRLGYEKFIDNFDNDTLYIKLQFMYSITFNENGISFNHVRSKDNNTIIVKPKQMILNDISLHV